MIVATAGHVDHGKTALVRALTGVDTDRLEEEKRRGLSINLGYAYLPRGNGTQLGFIDVPGHRRFINTMISGISGIDLAMLVVAADDGPMPQTLEHIAVLQLLGARELILVISKCDRVAAGRIDEVLTQLRALLPPSRQDVSTFLVNSPGGEGIPELREWLLAASERTSQADDSGCFRLSIDRTFNLKGTGLVVTGTASAGAVRAGETLVLQPSGKQVRVRGLRVHDREAARAGSGQRCALNLAGGLQLADVHRGDMLLSPGAAAPAANLDVSFRLLDSAPFALKHFAPVKLYLGARRVAGRLALLDRATCGHRLSAGTDCLAQLVLEEAVCARRGERFLLQDDAESVILGGGTVLDPAAPADRRMDDSRRNWLHALQRDSVEDSLRHLLANGGLVDLGRLARAWNLSQGQLSPNASCGVEYREFAANGSHWCSALEQWQSALESILDAVDRRHREQPAAEGIKARLLQEGLVDHVHPVLLLGAMTELLKSGALILQGGLVRHRDFQPGQTPEDASRWALLSEQIGAAGRNIPLLSELVQQTGLDLGGVRASLAAAVRDARLLQISERRYALPAQLRILGDELLQLHAKGEELTVVALKNRWQTGRNLTVEVLEYFDSIRFTQRQGNVRRVLDADLPARRFAD